MLCVESGEQNGQSDCPVILPQVVYGMALDDIATQLHCAVVHTSGVTGVLHLMW